MWLRELLIVLLTLTMASCAPVPASPVELQGLTRAEVEIGHDSTFAEPIVDPLALARLERFVAEREGRWQYGRAATFLGGLHLHLWRGADSLGVLSLMSNQLEWYRPGERTLTLPISPAESMEFARLINVQVKVIPVPPLDSAS